MGEGCFLPIVRSQIIAETARFRYQPGVAFFSKPNAFLCAAAALLAVTVPTQGDLFSEKVYPVLRENCFDCHGPDKRKGGLRLDRQREAMLGGDSGAVILPGDSAKSSLYRLVAALDEGKQMPPKGKLLPADSVAAIKQWIDSGAAWPSTLADGLADVRPTHWSFQQPKRTSPPPVRDSAWPNNPIDHFVLAKLEQEGVAPAPRAAKATLIRRLSFDLRGFPPSAAEVRDFLQNDSPEAYAQLVDRLLASDAFGEHWGRYWLDKARYADSDGYEKDNVRPTAWVWRDWVINAVNRDVPYDQFSIQQLAGDMLPGAGLTEKLATGFHRNTLRNTEGGTDQEEFRLKAVVDRLNTAGSIWLGLTIGCAECHTHKYDPITQREFYEMMAFFNTSDDRSMKAPSPDEINRYNLAKADWDKTKANLDADLAAYLENESLKKQVAWEKTYRPAMPIWAPFAIGKLDASGGVNLEQDDKGVVKASGDNPDTDTYTLTGTADLKRLTGVRLTSVKVNDKGAGRSDNGNFVVNELQAELLLPDGKTQPVEFTKAVATFSQNRFGVDKAIDGNTGSESGWAVAPKINQDNVALLAAKPVDLPTGTQLKITVVQVHGKKHTLGGLRLEVTDSDSPATFDSIPSDVIAALGVAANERNEAQRGAVQNWFRDRFDEQAKALRSKIGEHAKRAPKYPGTDAAVVSEQSNKRKTHIHVRGDFLRKGAEVKPATLSVMHSLQAKEAKEQPSRLDFAKWLFEKNNPLTGRVSANYIWQNLFGNALVKTVDDFGTRGELPSHPALLDWLATELPRLDWSRKELIRTIVSSATYQQSSATRDDLTARDPNNRWLARQNRFRLGAEGVRDAQLYAAGLLSHRKFGPSIKPPLPSDIAAIGYANSVSWKANTGENKYRRGLYIHAQRTVPYPMLTTFDANDTSVACMRRERSNTPLQALTLLNDPVFFEAAQALGQRMGEQGGDLHAQIRYGFERCVSRPASDAEIERLAKLYTVQHQLIADSPDSAGKITGNKEATPQQAALITLARVLLNLDEAITRE